MRPLPGDNSGDYLASTVIIDYGDAGIRRTADKLAAGTQDEIAVAKAIFEFVRDDIRHTFDVGAGEVSCRASDVLKYGHGLCYAKSHLLAALMRSRGVPMGFCYQRLTDEDQPSGFVLHGFNAVYLKSLDRWVKLDARGHKPGVNVQFNIDSDMHAFKVDERLGESEYPGIFAEPARTVLRVLSQYRSATMLRGRLPDTLCEPAMGLYGRTL